MFKKIKLALLERLKWAIAKEEMQELHDRRQMLYDYRRWLGPYQPVMDVLNNMANAFPTDKKTTPYHLNISDLYASLRRKYNK